MATRPAQQHFPFARPAAALAAILTAAAFVTPAAAEPASCLSPDPAQWPAPSKPYFMLAVSSSGSQGFPVFNQNFPAWPDPAWKPVYPSCAGYPFTRSGHARCALKQTVQAFGGQVNFGLSIYANRLINCQAGACGDNFTSGGCSTSPFGPANPSYACGPIDTLSDATTRHGANILVPMLQDHYWQDPPDASNAQNLLGYVDNDCTNSKEVFGILGQGSSPINGLLRDMYRYFSVGWTAPDNSVTYPSPLGDLPNERACRSVNIILVTDGHDDCDDPAKSMQPWNGPNNTPWEDAAAKLYAGFTKGGITWNVKTYVVSTAEPGSPAQSQSLAQADAIAKAGGTGAAVAAFDSATLAKTFSAIIGGSVAPEVCDNLDNNCNGCTDEGYKHSCDDHGAVPPPGSCCTDTHANCLASYKASITAAAPQGDKSLLPCVTAQQFTDPAQWLCVDPGEVCDGIDNNCNGQVDEGFAKCGNPLHCPQPEICDGLDNNCNGQVDEGGVCVCLVKPSPEVCDGCDNNCSGVADEGIAPVPCGLASPPNCVGTITCKPPQPVAQPGGCIQGGGANACSWSPQPEICDGIDNNCNGLIDDGIPPTPCVPPGTPPGLVYGGNSQCKMGLKPCNGVCQGFVGPSAEICDGLDNDCNGVVDDKVMGIGQVCGVNQPPCKAGTTACVNGALTCQGGVAPGVEVCDGIDNNCNGIIDEFPLADAPPAGQTGCWDAPGNCCNFKTLSWCPPVGATCTGVGTLAGACHPGALKCAGKAGWACSPSKDPSPEVCNGLDDDCDGAIDETGPSPDGIDGTSNPKAPPIAKIGDVCGKNVGECKLGAWGCLNGSFACIGGVLPQPETCDGKDNDCDGVIDNNVGAGGPCDAPYDMVAFPGDRSHPPCKKGVLVCLGAAGMQCQGSIVPSAEVCDNLDNDCDGTIDEPGAPPDGIDGTANPLPPPVANIGDGCGSSVGECKPGKWACQSGLFVCNGGVLPQPEQCDCLDNNCDGIVDNANVGDAGPPLCGMDKECVKAPEGFCQCAKVCKGEVPCLAGQKCEHVVLSETNTQVLDHCVIDCGDCASQTIKDPKGKVLCAPPDPLLGTCTQLAPCECKGTAGCGDPCLSVDCKGGTVCATAGVLAGKCAPDNCWTKPCPSCTQACSAGTCVDSPCKPLSCPALQECVPDADFKGFKCFDSCVGAKCATGEVCVHGTCVADCAPCATGETCDKAQSPPKCVPNKCLPSDPCVDGSYCDPVKGTCGNFPCAGVQCLAGQQCVDGSCFVISVPPVTTSSSTVTVGSGGGGPVASVAASSSSSGGMGGADVHSKGVWGLATGSGCTCEAAPGAGGTGSEAPDGRWALAVLALGACVGRARGRQSARGAGRHGTEHPPSRPCSGKVAR